MKSRMGQLLLLWVGLLVLLASLGALAGPQTFSSSATTTTTTSSGYIRLRANRLRRPESCRESLPRKSDDLPALVITGRVKEVYLADSSSNTNTNTNNNNPMSGAQSSNDQPQNRALVNVGRVIKGNGQLLGSDIIVSGFNSSSSVPCPNYVKANDSLILLLNHDTDRKYSIQGGNLLAMNLVNLDRVNAVALDEPFKRRGPIDDILCEAHYCPYGRCVAGDRGQLSCQCPDTCPPLPAPVCGSDNTTYASECHLIKEGCRRQRPLFVTKESSC